MQQFDLFLIYLDLLLNCWFWLAVSCRASHRLRPVLHKEEVTFHTSPVTLFSFFFLSQPVAFSWEVVQTSPDLPNRQLAPPPPACRSTIGCRHRFPAVEQCVGSGVPGGPWGPRWHPAGFLRGRPQWRHQQRLRRAGSANHGQVHVQIAWTVSSQLNLRISRIIGDRIIYVYTIYNFLFKKVFILRNFNIDINFQLILKKIIMHLESERFLVIKIWNRQMALSISI